MATTTTQLDKEGRGISDTQWHNLIAWGNTANFIEEFVVKGSEVAVHGQLTTKSYEGKDGERKYITEVLVDEILMLGKKPKV